MDKKKITRIIFAIAGLLIAVAGISYGLYSWLGWIAMMAYLAVVIIALVWMLRGMRHAIEVKE